MKKILAWAKRRLTERSTYVGLAAIATAVGLGGVAGTIGHAGEIVTIALGAGLTAATTTAIDTPAS